MNVIKLAGLLVIALIAVIIFAGIKTAEWACKGNGGKTAADRRLQKMNRANDGGTAIGRQAFVSKIKMMITRRK